tara:strand:- start:2409 stop:3305 length:897 start_codon:yes stop_codon:yes gene_type:complete
MENWRASIECDKLLESHEYVTKVLGIAIPLNESYPFSANLTEQILQEQLLLERFFDDAVAKVKQAAQSLGDKARDAIQDGTAWTKQFGENVGRVMHAIWIIFRDPSKVGEYIDILNERMNLRRVGEMDEFVENVVTLLSPTKLANVGEKISELWTSAKDKYMNMTESWKKALVGSSMMVILQYIFDKLIGPMKTVNNLVTSGIENLTPEDKENIGKQIKSSVLLFFEKSLGTVFEKMGEYTTGIGVWIDWLSKIVGGINYVATQLYGTTRQFLKIGASKLIAKKGKRQGSLAENIWNY